MILRVDQLKNRLHTKGTKGRARLSWRKKNLHVSELVTALKNGFFKVSAKYTANWFFPKGWKALSCQHKGWYCAFVLVYLYKCNQEASWKARAAVLLQMQFYSLFMASFRTTLGTRLHRTMSACWQFARDNHYNDFRTEKCSSLFLLCQSTYFRNLWNGRPHLLRPEVFDSAMCGYPQLEWSRL